jgi:carbon-monoxide dehydrogenase medium subunit
VAHADPAADYLPVLVTSGASVVLRSTRGERRMRVEDFVVDVMATRREPDELLVEIDVPKPPIDARSAYLRFARVEGSFALVNAAAIVTPRGPASWSVRVAIGGAGAKPVAIEVEQESGGPVSARTLETVSDAAHAATAHAHSDIAADRDYRRALARVLAVRATRAALDQSR